MKGALIVAPLAVSPGVEGAAMNSSPRLLLRHANVFTGETAPRRRDVTIAIVNGRIESVASSITRGSVYLDKLRH